MTPLCLSVRELSPSALDAATAAEAREWPVEIVKVGTEEKFSMQIEDPWTQNREQVLEWYLQDYPRDPLLRRGDAATVSSWLKDYGRYLADQLKACPFLWSYRGELSISVLAQTDVCPLQRLHWELLEDANAWGDDYGRRFRKITMWRSVYANDPAAPFMGASGKKDGQKHRVLFVVTRRTADGQHIDGIDSTLVTQPAFVQIKKNKYLAEGEVLRPPTWRAFKDLLMSRPQGYYDVVHFDMHGHVDRAEQSAFLEFQSETSDDIDSVPAFAIATLLVERGVDIANLNACESAKQLPDIRANMAYLFSYSGVPVTIGMAYDVLDNAAEIFEGVWYEEYLTHFDPAEATRRGRQALAHNRDRKGAFRSALQMDDYFVPCLYVSIAIAQPGPGPGDAAAASASSALWKLLGWPFGAHLKAKVSIRSRQPPEVAKPAEAETLVGRGDTIADLERKISRPNENVLFLVGPGGSGKTAMLEHLRSWWKQTGFVEAAHAFHLNDRKDRPHFTWSLFHFIRLALLGPFVRKAKSYDEAFNDVVRTLRERRVLLVLDEADFPVSLDVADDSARILNLRLIGPDMFEEYGHGTRGLVMFLEALVGGQSKVLLASRQVPQWVSENFQANNCFVLPPVVGDDAGRLSERLLGEAASARNNSRQIHQLVRHLDHNPLAMQVVLPLALDSRSKHPDLLNRLWSGELQSRSLWPRLRREPRFVDFLRRYCEAPDPQGHPVVNLFWVSEFARRPPMTENGVFWLWVFAFISGRIGDGTQLVDSIDLLPPIDNSPRNDSIHTARMDAFRQKLGIDNKQANLLSDLLHGDILVDNGGGTDLKWHPLYPHVARTARFGIKDAKKWARLAFVRRQATWRYTIYRLVRLVSDNRTEDGIAWNKVVPEAVEMFPDIIWALELACRPDVTSDTAFTMLAQANSSRVAFMVLDVACTVDETLRTPIAEVRRKYLGRSVQLPGVCVRDEAFFEFACTHALALARFAMPSQQCELADGPDVHIALAYDLCARFRASGIPGTDLLPLMERRTRLAEAVWEIELFKHESASVKIERLLSEEPELSQASAQESLTLAFISAWVIVLSMRTRQFPREHDLLKSGKKLFEIITETHAKTKDELARLAPTAQRLLRSTYYDLQKPNKALSLPPRGRDFDVLYERAYAGGGAARVIAANIAIDPEDYGEDDHEKAMKKLTWTMRKQSLLSSSVAGSRSGRTGLGVSGGGAASSQDSIWHVKLCEMALAQSKWAEAISHLTTYTCQKPSRLEVHMIYALCFWKLRMCDAARGHLVLALEVAQQNNNETFLPPIYGALAGMEFARRGHFSVLPKLLLLRGLAMVYAPGNTVESNLANRGGAFMGFLLHIVGMENVSMELGIDPRSMTQFSRQYPPLAEWEGRLNSLLTMVDQEMDGKLSYAPAKYDGGKLRRELSLEAENIIFLDERPAMVKRFIHSTWAQPFLALGKKVTFWDMFGSDQLTPSLTETLLEADKKGKGKAAGLVWHVEPDKLLLEPWELAKDSSSDDDSNGDRTRGRRKNRKKEKPWDRSLSFHEHFLEDSLVPAQSRLADQAREDSVKMLRLVDTHAEEFAELSIEGRKAFVSELVDGELARAKAASEAAAADRKMKKRKKN